MVHSAFGLGLLKVGVGAAAVTAAGLGTVGAVVVVQDMRESEDESRATVSMEDLRLTAENLEAYVAALLRNIQPLPEFPNAIYSRAEANAVARALALGVIENDPRLAEATVERRPFEPKDLQVVSHRFVEEATHAATALPGNAADFPTGANVWIATFVSRGWDTPFGPDQLNVTVSFVDGTAETLDSWMNRPAVSFALPEGARPIGPREVTQTIEIEGITWKLVVNTIGPPWGIGFSVSHPVVSETISSLDSIPLSGSLEEHAFGLLSAHVGETSVTFGGVGARVAQVEVETSSGQRYRTEVVRPAEISRVPFATFAVTHPRFETPVAVRTFDAAGIELSRASRDSIKMLD